MCMNYPRHPITPPSANRNSYFASLGNIPIPRAPGEQRLARSVVSYREGNNYGEFSKPQFVACTDRLNCTHGLCTEQSNPHLPCARARVRELEHQAPFGDDATVEPPFGDDTTVGSVSSEHTLSFASGTASVATSVHGMTTFSPISPAPPPQPQGRYDFAEKKEFKEMNSTDIKSAIVRAKKEAARRRIDKLLNANKAVMQMSKMAKEAQPGAEIR